jgi:uncharacterized protein (DUF736 family)
MSDYDDTNRGALFKNIKKESDKHPDYKGSLNVDGQEFWLSSWLKVSKSGEKYMSVSVTPKDEQKPAPKKPVASRVPGSDDDLADIPFADPFKGRKSYVV